MPGIAAIFSQHPDAPQRLQRMLAAFSSGPDLVRRAQPRLGTAVQAGSVLHRGSFAEGPAIWNEARDIALVFAGEVFTDPADYDELARRGHRVERTGAAHVVQLYEAHGERFLERMNGSFCGVLVDLRRGVSLLFNDRLGAGRLYLHEAEDGLYCASEAKALLRLFPRTRRLDPSAVAETFSFGCVIRDRTLFEGIGLLPPGSCWRIEPGGAVDKGRHFEPGRLENREPLPDAAFYEALRDTFAAVLPRYMAFESHPGMSLTGGLDGRMIMAWAHAAPRALPCYSFGSTLRDCHDVRLARRVAEMSGQSHCTLRVGPEMLAQFPELAARCVEVSDGTMDVSGAVEVYANRLAREISPVRITGNYGSEIMRGNVAFRPRALARERIDPGFAPEVDRAAERYRAERAVSDLAFVACKQVPWHHHARLSVEQSVLTVRSPFLDNRLVDLMARASSAVRASLEPSLRLIHDGSQALGDLPTDRGLAHGSPTATSKLRHAMREFSARAEYAYDYGMPDRLVRLDTALAGLRLERLFLGRHKFYHFRTWYRGPLADHVRDTLMAPNTRAARWFGPGVLRNMVKDHTSGRANRTLEIHRALTLELIERRLLDSAAHA
jgi:asparagine synthase (glutamine-hydrolysing)